MGHAAPERLWTPGGNEAGAQARSGALLWGGPEQRMVLDGVLPALRVQTPELLASCCRAALSVMWLVPLRAPRGLGARWEGPRGVGSSPYQGLEERVRAQGAFRTRQRSPGAPVHAAVTALARAPRQHCVSCPSFQGRASSSDPAQWDPSPSLPALAKLRLRPRALTPVPG